MNSNLSPLESLKAQRMKLQEECHATEKRIGENLHYVKDNFGTLLLSTALNAPKNGLKFLFGSADDEEQGSFFNSRIVSVLPLAWRLFQPLIIGWATKKITSFLFGSRSRKRK